MVASACLCGGEGRRYCFCLIIAQRPPVVERERCHLSGRGGRGGFFPLHPLPPRPQGGRGYLSVVFFVYSLGYSWVLVMSTWAMYLFHFGTIALAQFDIINHIKICRILCCGICRKFAANFAAAKSAAKENQPIKQQNQQKCRKSGHLCFRFILLK